MRGIWLGEDRSATQEGLYFMELDPHSISLKSIFISFSYRRLFFSCFPTKFLYARLISVVCVSTIRMPHAVQHSHTVTLGPHQCQRTRRDSLNRSARRIFCHLPSYRLSDIPLRNTLDGKVVNICTRAIRSGKANESPRWRKPEGGGDIAEKCIFLFLRYTLCISSIIYNKPTRCNSGSIVFIKSYKYALHVSDALCVHHQEHYKL